MNKVQSSRARAKAVVGKGSKIHGQLINKVLGFRTRVEMQLMNKVLGFRIRNGGQMMNKVPGLIISKQERRKSGAEASVARLLGPETSDVAVVARSV